MMLLFDQNLSPKLVKHSHPKSFTSTRDMRPLFS